MVELGAVVTWLQSAGIMGGLAVVGRHEARIDGLMKVSDERDDRLHERLVRIEGKLDALREDLRGN